MKFSYLKEEIRQILNEADFEPKDEMRIKDIGRKSNYVEAKMIQLTNAMASKITDKNKAFRRGMAARAESNLYSSHDPLKDVYLKMADIFFRRADMLGHPEAKKMFSQGSKYQEPPKQSSTAQPRNAEVYNDPKKLFRSIAFKIHPDRALNFKGRELGNELMKQLNAAYQKRDKKTMIAIEKEWERHPIGVRESALKRHLRRAILIEIIKINYL